MVICIDYHINVVKQKRSDKSLQMSKKLFKFSDWN